MAEFYGKDEGPELGDPQADPPMTVRVESWEQRYHPLTRRVIKTDTSLVVPWVQVTGTTYRMFTNVAVRDWPICPPIVYTAAFRHEGLRKVTRTLLAAEPVGDMGVEAFRGEGDVE